MTDHLALFLRLHFRDVLLRADTAWRHAMCWSLGHDWRIEPFALKVRCTRCDDTIRYEADA